MHVCISYINIPDDVFPIVLIDDTVCPDEQFPCGDSLINGTDKLLCLDRVLHCNGELDCPRGEDELNCGKTFLTID
jgi:hypothetical protein